MADLTLRREEGDGAATELHVRVPDTAWSGLDAVIEILDVVRIPAQRTSG